MTLVAEVELEAIPEYEYVGPNVRLLLILVEKEQATPGLGDVILRKAQRHFPALPGMLVAVTDNGFVAHAAFQTHTFLALAQMIKITWVEIDLDADPDVELPF